MSEDNTDRSNFSKYRRGYLKALGGVGVIGTAGCIGEGNGGGGTDDDDGRTEDGIVEQILHLPIHLGERPSDMNFNPWGRSAAGPPALFEQLIDWDPVEEEYIPYTIDWEFDGDVWRWEVVEGVKWHNGDDVTAEDISVSLRINKIQTPDGEFEKYYDEVTVVDDRTLELSLTDDWSHDTMLFRLHGQRLQTRWDDFSDYVEGLEDATSDEEADEVLADLQDFTIEEPIGTGMFEWEDTRAQRLILHRWDDHIDADHVQFTELRYRFYESNQAMWSALQGDELDIIYGNQVLLTEQMIEGKGDNITEHRQNRHGGLNLVPQHEDEQMGDLHVRKALAYVINRENAAENVGRYTENPAPLYTSISSSEQEHWLGDVIDDFTVYGPESKEEEAEDVLHEGGYEKEDDVWVDPNGDPLEILINVSADRESWVTASQTVVGQLNEFGINAELSADDPSSYWTRYPEGEWDKLATGFWGHPAAEKPFFQLWLSLLRLIPGEASNYPVESAEVPMPVGDPDGSIETVNLEEAITEMEKLDDEDEIRERVQLVAWAFNQTVPSLPLLQGVHQTAADRTNWEMPDPDAPEMINYHLEKVRLPQYLLRRNELHPA